MIPDFGRIRGIVLSYPISFSDPFYRSLTSFYDRLIALLPNDILICLVVADPSDENTITQKFSGKKIKVINVHGFNEIWLRDILGFPHDGKVVLPTFAPTYFKSLYTDVYLQKLDFQVRGILADLEFEIQSLDLVWDGGNLIHNSRIGFVTDKLLKDNPGRTKSQIKSRIVKALSIDPIFIPTFKYDTLGHADGYLNFFSQDGVALSNYPSISFLENSTLYSNKLREILFDNNLQIVDVWDRPFSEHVKIDDEYLESARGVYNNFLQVNGTLILPDYKSSKDSSLFKYQKRNLKSLSPFFPSINTINCDQLSSLGGVLHCVSWTF